MRFGIPLILTILGLAAGPAAAIPAESLPASAPAPLNGGAALGEERGEDFHADAAAEKPETTVFGGSHGAGDAPSSSSPSSPSSSSTSTSSSSSGTGSGTPPSSAVSSEGTYLGPPSADHGEALMNKVKKLAEKMAPAEHTVVDRELGELHSLLGNYKAHHETTQEVHKAIRHELEYHPDGMPKDAKTPEDKMLRELRRTAEVVREHRGLERESEGEDAGAARVGVPVGGDTHHPEPESLDPYEVMQKKAIDNLPVANGQKDVEPTPTAAPPTPAPATPTPTPAHVQSIYSLVDEGEDAVLPVNDGILH